MLQLTTSFEPSEEFCVAHDILLYSGNIVCNILQKCT